MTDWNCEILEQQRMDCRCNFFTSRPFSFPPSPDLASNCSSATSSRNGTPRIAPLGRIGPIDELADDSIALTLPLSITMSPLNPVPVQNSSLCSELQESYTHDMFDQETIINCSGEEETYLRCPSPDRGTENNPFEDRQRYEPSSIQNQPQEIKSISFVSSTFLFKSESADRPSERPSEPATQHSEDEVCEKCQQEKPLFPPISFQQFNPTNEMYIPLVPDSAPRPMKENDKDLT